MKLLSNHDIFILSKTMSLDDLLAKVHETQPGITMKVIKGIIRACKKQSRPTPAPVGQSACGDELHAIYMRQRPGDKFCGSCGAALCR